jgi:hypothetical protein
MVVRLAWLNAAAQTPVAGIAAAANAMLTAVGLLAGQLSAVCEVICHENPIYAPRSPSALQHAHAQRFYWHCQSGSSLLQQ